MEVWEDSRLNPLTAFQGLRTVDGIETDPAGTLFYLGVYVCPIPHV